MTGIQEAIERLGVRKDSTDNASRSFSFASSSRTDEEDDIYGGDHGEYGAGWSKKARKFLAANAAKQQQLMQRPLRPR